MVKEILNKKDKWKRKRKNAKETRKIKQGKSFGYRGK
jgi:hypothetical protein